MKLLVSVVLAIVVKISGVFSSPVLDAVSVGKTITTNGRTFVENNGQYPFIASLAYYGSHRCGATIIKPLFVLTAAHCFDNLDPTKWMVRAGTFLKDDSPKNNKFVKEIKVARFKNHPSYDPKESNVLDISVVKLEEPFIFNFLISAIKLPNENMAKKFTKKKLTVLGYGEKSDFVNSNILRKGEVVVSKEKCGKLDYFQMCTIGSHNSNAGMHFGDSDGPVILEVPGKPVAAVIVGVSSRGVSPPGKPTQPSSQSPSIYVEVATLRQWIDFIVEDLKRGSKSN